jgi:hypothetical protein
MAPNMVLQHRKVDDRVTKLGEGLRHPAAHAAVDGQFALVTQDLVPQESYAPRVLGDPEPRAFQVLAEPVPDDDVLLLHPGLLEPLADRLHQGNAGGTTLARQAIDLQTHGFAGLHHLAPCLYRLVALEIGLHGAVQQIRQPRLGIARDHDPGSDW